MPRQFSEEEAKRHDSLHEEAWGLVKNEISLDGTPLGSPGWFARRRLAKAITLFEQMLAINPEGWQAMWALGKIHQRLQQQTEACAWFGRAFELEPNNPDVPREAAISAMESGDFAAAIRYNRAAIEKAPGDAGLKCNLALCYLLGGDVEQAWKYISIAHGANKDDQIAQHLLGVIADVRSGKRRAPKRLAELM